MGPLAVYGGLSRDVADSALLMNVLTRPDARDSFAIPFAESIILMVSTKA